MHLEGQVSLLVILYHLVHGYLWKLVQHQRNSLTSRDSRCFPYICNHDFLAFSCCVKTGYNYPVGWLHTSECGHCEMLNFRIRGARQNIYVFSFYRNPDLDDQIYNCLLTSVAAVQAEDVPASFMFMSDRMAINNGWVLRPWIAIVLISAFDFATVSGWGQLIVHGETLIWPPDDWCFWHCNVNVPKLLVSRKVFLKSSAIHDPPWHNIWSAEVLNESSWGFERILLRFWTIIWRCRFDFMH